MVLRRMLVSMGFGTVLVVAAYISWGSLGQGRISLARVLSDRAEAVPESGSASGVSSFRVAAQGRVEPVTGQLDLAIGMVGTLSTVTVDQGDKITKGQLLAELVSDDQRARIAEAEAQVKLHTAELDKLLHGARAEERRQAEAQVEKTGASVALAQQELARRRPLAANRVASQQSLEQAVSSMQVALASDSVNRAALDLIKAPPREEDIAVRKANLDLAEANLQEQRAILQKMQIISPIDGVVLRRYLKAGETISIQPLIPVLQVGETGRLRIRAEIDETDVGRLRVGQRATATAPAYSDRLLGGVITKIGEAMGRKTVRSEEPTEKNDTNVLEVFIDLDDSNVRLPVGLRVNVFLEPAVTASN
jgi:HlyD family secretion protein